MKTASEIFRSRIMHLLSGREAKDVSVASGIAQATISNWKLGKATNPTLKSLQKAAAALGVKPAELISEPGQPSTFDVELADAELDLAKTEKVEAAQRERVALLRKKKPGS